MINIAVFDTKNYDIPGFEMFGNLNGVTFKFFESKLTPDTVSLSNGFDGVCIFVNDNVNEDVINALVSNNVKLVALRCAGYNNVDVRSAFGKIHIVRVPAYSPYAVAEHAIAMLLTSIRRIHKAYNRTREYNFSLNGLTGFDLYGKTVGVVGTGRIGRIFINICKGFGMKVLAYDKFPIENPDFEYVELDDIYKRSDIISLHCPLTPETSHLLNSKSISEMKKGVVIINTSRGGLIDSDALLEGIKSKKIGAACLDVYEEEADIFFEDRSGHIVQDDTLARLISMPNVILTSHQAFLTEEALNNIAETTVNNISRFFSEGICDNEVCYRCGDSSNCKKSRKDKCF